MQSAGGARSGHESPRVRAPSRVPSDARVAAAPRVGSRRERLQNPSPPASSCPSRPRARSPRLCLADGLRTSPSQIQEGHPFNQNDMQDGGGTRNRTGDDGFAIRCLTTWLCRLAGTPVWPGSSGAEDTPNRDPAPDAVRHPCTFAAGSPSAPPGKTQPSRLSTPRASGAAGGRGPTAGFSTGRSSQPPVDARALSSPGRTARAPSPFRAAQQHAPRDSGQVSCKLPVVGPSTGLRTGGQWRNR